MNEVICACVTVPFNILLRAITRKIIALTCFPLSFKMTVKTIYLIFIRFLNFADHKITELFQGWVGQNEIIYGLKYSLLFTF